MARVSIALVMLLLSVMVDFTSRVLSVAVDGMIVIIGVAILIPVIIKGLKNN